MARITARTTASLVGVNLKTAISYFHRLRELIHQNDDMLEQLAGEVEVDESYFGGKRKGKRSCGAAGKVPVFGLLKRHGKVYAVMIQTRDTLVPIIRQKVQPDSIVYSDTFKSYHALDVSEFKHERMNHSRLFANKRITSMALRSFRTRRSAIYADLMAFPKNIFICF